MGGLIHSRSASVILPDTPEKAQSLRIAEHDAWFFVIGKNSDESVYWAFHRRYAVGGVFSAKYVERPRLESDAFDVRVSAL